MSDDRAPRMPSREYTAYLERAADATSAAEVRQLRAEVLARWRGDPQADDFAEALYIHERRLAGGEWGGYREDTRVTSRLGGRARR